jgi:hypothetical protein
VKYRQLLCRLEVQSYEVDRALMLGSFRHLSGKGQQSVQYRKPIAAVDAMSVLAAADFQVRERKGKRSCRGCNPTLFISPFTCILQTSSILSPHHVTHYYHITTSPHYLTTSLPHHFITSSSLNHLNITSSPHTLPPHHLLTSSSHHSSPHHLITTSPHHLITSTPHHLITSLPHHLITSSPH